MNINGGEQTNQSLKELNFLLESHYMFKGFIMVRNKVIIIKTQTVLDKEFSAI